MHHIFKLNKPVQVLFCLFVMATLTGCSSRASTLKLVTVVGTVPPLNEQTLLQPVNAKTYQWYSCGQEKWRFAFQWHHQPEDTSTDRVLVSVRLPEVDSSYLQIVREDDVQSFEVTTPQHGAIQLAMMSAYHPQKMTFGWNVERKGDQAAEGCDSGQPAPESITDGDVNNNAKEHEKMVRPVPLTLPVSHVQARLHWDIPVDIDLSSNWMITPKSPLFLSWMHPRSGRNGTLSRDANSPCLNAQRGNEEFIDWYLPADKLADHPDKLMFYVTYFSDCNHDVPSTKVNICFTYDNERYGLESDLSIDEVMPISLADIVKSKSKCD